MIRLTPSFWLTCAVLHRGKRHLGVLGHQAIPIANHMNGEVTTLETVFHFRLNLVSHQRQGPLRLDIVPLRLQFSFETFVLALDIRCRIGQKNTQAIGSCHLRPAL